MIMIHPQVFQVNQQAKWRKSHQPADSLQNSQPSLQILREDPAYIFHHRSGFNAQDSRETPLLAMCFLLFGLVFAAYCFTYVFVNFVFRQMNRR